MSIRKLRPSSRLFALSCLAAACALLGHDRSRAQAAYDAGALLRENESESRMPQLPPHATRVADEAPGLRVAMLLAAGDQPGETDIIAETGDRPLLARLGGIDDFDARATSAARAGVSLSIDDVAGVGDQFSLLATTMRGRQYRLRDALFGVPLGAGGLRAGLNASSVRYELRGEVGASRSEGHATTVGAAATYPIRRRADFNLYASAALDHRILVNDSDAGNLSDKRTDTLLLSVDGDRSDTAGGGGATVGTVSVTAGRLGLGRNAAEQAADQAGPRRAGRFAKFNANAGRLQRLSASANLWLAASGQFASRNLDSSEQLSLGGASGVRAYPTLEGSGDAGWLVTAEYRHRVTPALQVAAFYDHGQIERERDVRLTSQQPNRYALKGAGFGVEYLFLDRLTLRSSVAWRIDGNPAAGLNGRDSDATRRVPQWFASLSLPF